MGPDVPTISRLAHHKSIETTCRHYGHFNAKRILGEMVAAFEDRNNPPAPFPSSRSNAFLLHSPPPVDAHGETTTEKPDSE
jgi:hypothetical protein